MASQVKGIRCNETQFVAKKDQDVIRYQFVTTDDNTPSYAEIRLGDVDPMTGEQITDESIFHGYYAQVNQEVRSNLDQIRIEKTKKERQKTKELKAVLSAGFEAEHGYRPNADNLRLLVEKEEGTQYIVIPTESYRNKEKGTPCLDKMLPYSVPFEDPFEDDRPIMVRAMEAVAETLTGRQKEFFEALSEQCGADEGNVRFRDLADQFDVSQAMITKMRKKLAAMIKVKAAELAAE